MSTSRAKGSYFSGFIYIEQTRSSHQRLH